MKIATKFLAIVLVLCMLTAAFAACGKGGSKGGDDTEVNIDESKLAVSSREVVTASYGATETSEALTVTMNLDLVDDSAFADYPDWELYKDVLGDYYKYLLAAKAQSDVSAKYAVMAIAEAKLLESGAFLPLTTEGGNYAISRVAPNTGNNALWGLDADRYESLIVATNFITAADRDVMRAKYLELKGTGKYQSWVLEYLAAKGYTTKDSYSIGYSSEPKTWDILKTYRAADSRAIINTIDGLLSYDCEGRLCFALAKSV
ncbi:MAG: peptide ABC transporter substrate-binding protein, partial [Clostridia bacterium]|nr:peptide ABC transporter substrate-binding protein [Clostridia bacterium]